MLCDKIGDWQKDTLLALLQEKRLTGRYLTCTVTGETTDKTVEIVTAPALLLTTHWYSPACAVVTEVNARSPDLFEGPTSRCSGVLNHLARANDSRWWSAYGGVYMVECTVMVHWGVYIEKCTLWVYIVECTKWVYMVECTWWVSMSLHLIHGLPYWG